MFMLIDKYGLDDGPFYAEQLHQNSLIEGKPWGLLTDGMPRVLRVRKQKGDMLYLEDGIEYRIQEIDEIKTD
jgi:hypothetical protein